MSSSCSTCRTAFNWAGRRTDAAAFAENPFAELPIDTLRDRDSKERRVHLRPPQEVAFFEACSEWQGAIFVTLATYGLRVGELTHLLVEDVDFAAGSFRIRVEAGAVLEREDRPQPRAAAECRGSGRC